MKEANTKTDVKDKNLVFAKRFVSLRKSRGLTQRAIAEKLGITDGVRNTEILCYSNFSLDILSYN